ncbi:MAG: A/G-specific adenine glycosylase [Patescibacteria group bacterium]
MHIPLLRWYDRHGRDLPWRHTRDPYRILVSEIMLQQTQVSRVLLYYKTWLKQFPTFAILAKASNADVIHAWAGLGYNRRALMLRDVARSVLRPPDGTEKFWLSLKGIGPYTAAAIACFAYHERTLPIDTNIRRVLARFLFAIPFPTLAIDDRIRKRIDDILPKRGRFFDVPQALFDLATLVCTKTPACASCPLRKTCKAAPRFLDGRVRTPKAMIKKANETIQPGKKYPDRIYRGRILAVIRKQGQTDVAKIGALIDPTFIQEDQPWIERMTDRMQKDRLVKRIGDLLELA